MPDGMGGRPRRDMSEGYQIERIWHYDVAIGGNRQAMKAAWSQDFLRRVKAMRFDDTFNPYVDRCPVHDTADSPSIRERNLAQCLEAAVACEVTSVWVARDLGHRGGRRTGLALTDEVHLEAHGRMLGCDFSHATCGEPMAERTATVIWDMLARVGGPVFLWNVFPLHPHEEGAPLSNRKHKRREADAGLEILRDLLGRLDPDRVVAIGRDAAFELGRLGVNAIPVRHPSYGGEAEFRAGVSRCYGL